MSVATRKPAPVEFKYEGTDGREQSVLVDPVHKAIVEKVSDGTGVDPLKVLDLVNNVEMKRVVAPADVHVFTKTVTKTVRENVKNEADEEVTVEKEVEEQVDDTEQNTALYRFVVGELSAAGRLQT